MIKVFFEKTEYITSVVISGHAMFSESGTDIVCASVSSMAILAFNTCIEFDSKIKYEIDEKKGYLKLTTNKYLKNVDTVLNTLHIMLNELEIQYPKYISVNNGGESYD
ncbi:MAG: ribosomal-processing cysteine protease Prp [Bacilli bacterium]